MLFNSIEFAFFLFLTFIIYWMLAKRIILQNLFLLGVSYLFYGWWDWRFLFLIIFSTVFNFGFSLAIANEDSPKKRKIYLLFCIFINLGILGFFKYFNFFIENFVEMMHLFGWKIQVGLLDIILPVGISFFTFQTLSYTIDVYRRDFKVCKDLLSFSTYVSFFPQLVAGPIERATNLLPQFYVKRIFDLTLAKDGLRQILWGLFMKVVIADNCAVIVAKIFGASNYSELGSMTLIFGGIFFAFQIYCDFAGYSNIALGTAKLFGFELMTNFKTPFFSKSITEFWRRWHTSLSGWFNDYVFTPIVVAKRDWGNWGIITGLFITFLLSGLWHGAAWTFIVYGALQGIALIIEFLLKKQRKKWSKSIPKWTYDGMSLFLTFSFSVFTMIIFRSDSLTSAGNYLYALFTGWNVGFFAMFLWMKETVFLMILVLIIFEWRHLKIGHGLSISYLPITVRWPMYYAFILLIIFYGNYREEIDFIYFQF